MSITSTKWISFIQLSSLRHFMSKIAGCFSAHFLFVWTVGLVCLTILRRANQTLQWLPLRNIKRIEEAISANDYSLDLRISLIKTLLRDKSVSYEVIAAFYHDSLLKLRFDSQVHLLIDSYLEFMNRTAKPELFKQFSNYLHVPCPQFDKVIGSFAY